MLGPVQEDFPILDLTFRDLGLVWAWTRKLWTLTCQNVVKMVVPDPEPEIEEGILEENYMRIDNSKMRTEKSST